MGSPSPLEASSATPRLHRANLLLDGQTATSGCAGDNQARLVTLPDRGAASRPSTLASLANTHAPGLSDADAANHAASSSSSKASIIERWPKLFAGAVGRQPKDGATNDEQSLRSGGDVEGSVSVMARSLSEGSPAWDACSDVTIRPRRAMTWRENADTNASSSHDYASRSSNSTIARRRPQTSSSATPRQSVSRRASANDWRVIERRAHYSCAASVLSSTYLNDPRTSIDSAIDSAMGEAEAPEEDWLQTFRSSAPIEASRRSSLLEGMPGLVADHLSDSTTRTSLNDGDLEQMEAALGSGVSSSRYSFDAEGVAARLQAMSQSDPDVPASKHVDDALMLALGPAGSDAAVYRFENEKEVHDLGDREQQRRVAANLEALPTPLPPSPLSPHDPPAEPRTKTVKIKAPAAPKSGIHFPRFARRSKRVDLQEHNKQIAGPDSSEVEVQRSKLSGGRWGMAKSQTIAGPSTTTQRWSVRDIERSFAHQQDCQRTAAAVDGDIIGRLCLSDEAREAHRRLELEVAMLRAGRHSINPFKPDYRLLLRKGSAEAYRTAWANRPDTDDSIVEEVPDFWAA